MEETLPGRYLRRTRETIRYEGPLFLLWRIVVKGVSPWGSLGMMSLLKKDLTRPLEKIPANIDLTICQATEADIEQLATLILFRHRRRRGLAPFMNQALQGKFSILFRQGHRCFLGKIGSKIVHYNWIFFRWFESVTNTGRFVLLRDDEALLNDAYTLDQWRGRSIHTIVQYHMLLFLQESGYRTAYTFAPTNNKSSLKTHHRLQWKRSGIMVYFIPYGPGKAKIWRLRGTLDPFAEQQIPFETQIKSFKAWPDSMLMSRGQRELKAHKPIGLIQRFKKKTGIILREEGEGAFLFEPETNLVKYLNPSAKEIFLMLSDQKDVEQSIHHLHRLYPDTDPNQIRRDVELFLNDLDQNGFICRIDAA